MRDVLIHVNIAWDAEADVWVATSDDIRGLALESESLDALRVKVMGALPDLVELNGFKHEGNDIPAQFLVEDSLRLVHCA